MHPESTKIPNAIIVQSHLSCSNYKFMSHTMNRHSTPTSTYPETPNRHSSFKHTSTNPRKNKSEKQSTQSTPLAEKMHSIKKINPLKHGHLACSHHFRKRRCLERRQMSVASLPHSTGAVCSQETEKCWVGKIDDGRGQRRL